MFHAVKNELVDLRGLWFSHKRGDTAELNRIAAEGGADVVAISAGAYPGGADRYLMLPRGASVGRGYGPVVVAKHPLTVADLAGRRVGIPGLSTTAWMVLRLIEPRTEPVVIPIVPFARIFDALDAGEVEAALLIHEGRLLYERRGLHKVVDIGHWWAAQTGLPLPLGVNVVRRALGDDMIRTVSSVLRDGIRYAFAHRSEIIRELVGEDRGDDGLADTALLDRYLDLYANQDTLELAPDVRAGVDALFARARVAGLLGSEVSVDWAP